MHMIVPEAPDFSQKRLWIVTCRHNPSVVYEVIGYRRPERCPWCGEQAKVVAKGPKPSER